MNCKNVQPLIESYIDSVDGILDSSDSEDVATHLSHCSVCNEIYTQQKTFISSLSKLPVPQPPTGYKKRAFVYAKKTHADYNSGFKQGALIATFASVAIMIVITWLFEPAHHIQTTQSNISSQLHNLQISFNESRVVQLIFDSPVNIDAANIALKLPADITLLDVPKLNIPGTRTVSWNINIKQGKNRLSLPIKARGRKGGQVVAELRHNGEIKTFIINVAIDEQKVIYQNHGIIQPFI